MTDDGLAAGFDNAGTDEQVLFAELGIVHASRVGSEVVGFVGEPLGQMGISILNLAEGSDEFGDLCPYRANVSDGGRFRRSGISGRWDRAGAPRRTSAAGGETIDDLNGGQMPDPLGAVANDDLLLGAAPTAFPGLDKPGPRIAKPS